MPEKVPVRQLKNALLDSMEAAIVNPKNLNNSFPFLAEVNEYSDVIWYKIEDFENRILRASKKSEVIDHIVWLSGHIIRSTKSLLLDLGKTGTTSHSHAKEILSSLETSVRLGETARRLEDSPKPIEGMKDASARSWCLYRAPTPLNGETSKAVSCPFLDSVFANFKYESMRTILKCFIARVYLGERSSRQMLYWFGQGGDGKSALLSYLQRTLRHQGVCFPHSYLEGSFSSETYGDKRFLFIEEADKGNFMTGILKAITGTEEIHVNPKGYAAFKRSNRLIIAIASNHKPACNGEPSEISRLRYIESKTDPNRELLTSEEIESQLDSVWWPFVEHCIAVYKENGETIPANEQHTYQELIRGKYTMLDSKIQSLLVYKEGARTKAWKIARLSKSFAGEEFVRRLQAIVPEGCRPIETQMIQNEWAGDKTPCLYFVNVSPIYDTEDPHAERERRENAPF